ncbi:MAG: transglycosylase SLT domain-containing protein, partial [Nitrospirota bacterium]
RKAFDSALHELLKIEDKRAGSILITVASDRRKNGKNEEAIRMYRDVIEKYPSETEDALWGIGWAYFLTGEYKKASDIFTKLYNNYNDTKYLYWKARSLEATGENALDIYHALMKKDGDFYSIMSYVRTKRPLERSSTPPFNSLLSKGGYRGVKGDEGGFSNETQKFPETTTNFIGGIPVGSKKIDRVEALFELGLSKEALLELIQISKTISLIEDLLYIGLKFQELGEYKHMASLATKIPYRERLNHLCYPLAYWDTVEALSKKYGVDPFLVLSIVREESMFDLKAMSAAGALGLMQVMPQIAYRLNSKLQLGISTAYQLYNYKDNIHLGTYYLSTLIKEFGSYTYAIAAYNAGEEAVKRWLQKGNYRSADEFIEDIPYSETKNYVKRVITSLFEYKRIYPIDDSTKEISLGNL